MIYKRANLSFVFLFFMATSKLLASAFSASASRPKVALVTGATDGIGLTTAKVRYHPNQ